MLLCCDGLSLLFFLVLRRDILTVDNVKAESEEEPRGGLEAGLSETVCGPRVQADSGPGAAGGGGDSSGVHLKNTTYPRGPPLCLRMQ